MPEGDEPGTPIDPKEFDRTMNEKVLAFGSRHDEACPACGERGYRRVADSEMVALYACRLCGHQEQVLHEARSEVEPPFREYREGRGFTAAVEDAGEGPAGGADP